MDFKYEITDCTFELELCDTVFVSVDKSTTAQMFEDQKSVPCNDDKPNKEYVEGELQYNIAKDSDDILEILLFPVYKDTVDGECADLLINGDFIIPPEYVLNNEDMKKDVISYRHRIRKIRTSPKNI